ncbi:MAG TPA: aspartate kinase [Gemmatimonadales bacterium]|nr:aspartate kinase [Gemmatimonadales bacterium]
MATRPARPSIHKFGGAALKDAGSMLAVTRILAEQPTPQIVVVSALAGVTDALLDLIAVAESGDQSGAVGRADAFRARHESFLAALLPATRRAPIQAAITEMSDELVGLARALAVLREASPRLRDHIVARGERLSALLLAGALSRARQPAEAVDPGAVIITDGPHGGAAPVVDATRRAARATLEPMLARGVTPVIPGFLGRAPGGGLATLGRGGSDLTATSLGRAMTSPQVTLWKDVPGLLTADPRIVPDARLLELVHPTEAAELAYYGANVLHPRALLPLAGTRTALRVRPFGDPTAPGTEISARRESAPPPVRSLSAVRDQALVTVSGSGILGVPGMSARTFGALQAADISVSLIAQASSEYTIDFTVPDEVAEHAVEVLHRAFRAEIAHGELEAVRTRRGVAILAVVGLRMAGHPGIAARVFEALELAEVNVVAIAQGSSEHNISIVVDTGAVPAGLRRIHAAFQLGKEGGGRPRRRTGKDVVLLGAGTIGRATLEMLAAAPARFGMLRVVAVVDRTGMVADAGGFDPVALRAIAACKRAGGGVAGLPGGVRGTPAAVLATLAQQALIRPVIADLTADDSTALLTMVARAGFDVVLANKRPVAGPWTEYRALRDALAAHGGRLRHEATVGAGLPLVLAVDQLLRTGDRVHRLEGVLSGTLAAVLTSLEDGVPFSEAVLAAESAGMTEPDPRDDLHGTDVARKALILARMLGQHRELHEVATESLVRGTGGGTMAAWRKTLARDDAWWQARVVRARDKGKVLRYVASITASKTEVGLHEVPHDHPLGQLRGPSNRLVITSDRYHAHPLVITGPGAGPEVTATGVVADLLSLTGA